MSREPSQRQ